jgi:hypothetical protein
MRVRQVERKHRNRRQLRAQSLFLPQMRRQVGESHIANWISGLFTQSGELLGTSPMWLSRYKQEMQTHPKQLRSCTHL